jgi:hypothetical protein
MTIYLVRIFLYTLLPLITAALLTRLDKKVKDRVQTWELFLLYLFALGVAGSGIGGFFGHLFLSDTVAQSIGWEAGSPFQLEMGFANLALGVLGLVATGRRDGFREATVMAVTVIGFGATIVHLIDILQTGNLAPGNTWQNVSNLVRPALLIGFLIASRRAERTGSIDESWRSKHVQAAGWMTGMAATGFGLGFALDVAVLGTTLGVLAGAIVVSLTVFRRPGLKVDSGR